MLKKTKLQKLISVLSPDQTQVDFQEFDTRVAELKKSLQEKIQAQTLDDVNSKLEKFKSKINLDPLLEAMSNIETGIENRIDVLSEMIDAEIESLKTELKNGSELSNSSISSTNQTIELLKSELSGLEIRKNTELADLKIQLEELKNFNTEASGSFEGLRAELEGLGGNHTLLKTELETSILKALEEIGKVRTELSNRINNIRIGGGNQNRNISVGGNSSVLSKYTDINLKAGSNVTITYSNNDTTKNVDITIAATGGGGSSVTGIVRSINSVSTSQAMGNTAGTDYVYLATAGIKLDLPSGVGNTNQYTIKNISNSSVLVAGTIDDDPSGIIMPVKYTSIDVVSNDTDWKIT